MSLSANQRPHKRLHEYFAVMGLPAELELSPDQRRHAAVNPLEARYVTQCLDRYPLEDHEDVAFPSGIGLFCLPCGLTLTTTMQMPRYSCFVHTDGLGRHLYGHSLTIWEPLRERQRRQIEAMMAARGLAAELAEAGELLAPKCLVVMSFWPHHVAYREWLKQLYRMSLSPAPLPIERYICNFMDEVPLPPPGRIVVQVSIADTTISFHTPPANAPTSWGALPYQPLFECLPPAEVIKLFTCLLLEKQVVLVSSQHFLLSTCAEVITSLLYPLRWSHVYIPILPAPLFGVLHAPMPFLIGLHTDAMRYAVRLHTEECGAFADDAKAPPPPTPPSPCADGDAAAGSRHASDASFETAEDALSDDGFCSEPSPQDVAAAAMASALDLDLRAADASALSVRELADALAPEGVVRVFLDEGVVDTAGEKLPPLPERRHKKLLAALRRSGGAHAARAAGWEQHVLPFYDAAFHHAYRPCDADDVRRELEASAPFWRRFGDERERAAPPPREEGDGGGVGGAFDWNEVREHFLRFFVALLRDYRKFVVFPTRKERYPPVRFRAQEFLGAQPGDRQALLRAMMATQLFQNFVDERCWPDALTAMDIDLFDEAIDAKRNRSKVRLKNRDTPLLRSQRFSNVGTYVAHAPCADGLPAVNVRRAYSSARARTGRQHSAPYSEGLHSVIF